MLQTICYVWCGLLVISVVILPGYPEDEDADQDMFKGIITEIEERSTMVETEDKSPRIDKSCLKGIQNPSLLTST